MKTRLNLGCGRNIKEGYINLDRVSLKGVDLVWDLDVFPYPFKNSQFEEILAEDSLLAYVSDLVKTMDELYRISKNNAKIKIAVPYFNNIMAYASPMFKNRFFTLDTFTHFTPEGDCWYAGKGSFKIIKQELIPTKLGKWIPFKKFLLNKIAIFIPNLVQAIHIELSVLKNE